MGRLHELLAVETTTSNAAQKLISETKAKFGKFEYFQGHEKILKMLLNHLKILLFKRQQKNHVNCRQQ